MSLSFTAMVKQAPDAYAYPPCSNITQPVVSAMSRDTDGNAVFSWSAAGGGDEFEYSYTGFTGSSWTAWTGWILTGNSTTVTVPFRVGDTPVIRLAFAVTARCYGPSFTPANVTIDYIRPASAPDGVTVTMGSDSATVFARPSPANSGEGITQFIITAQPQGQTCSYAANSAQSCVISGLRPSVEYTFSARAVNAVRTSSPSQSSASYTVATRPGAPTSVQAAIVKGTAVVSWSPPSMSGNGGALTYSVQVTPDGPGCETTDLTCEVSDLRPGVAYTFTVTARNSVGTGEPATAGEAKRWVGRPDAPRNVVARLTSRGILVTWKAPSSSGGLPIVRYEVTLGGQTICRSPKSTCLFTRVSPGTTIAFTVRAVNANGAGLPRNSPPVNVPRQGVAIS